MASDWLRSTYRVVCSRRSLPAILVGLFTLAYFAATCDLASLKPFWFDELTTYYIARSPTAGGVWRAWLESGDAVPPLVHLSMHFIGSALGFTHVTARLPDMLGFWLMCTCVFIFLRRRLCPMLAWVGMLLPLTVPTAYAYAYEARGYGMAAGFSAAAVLCWDLVDDTRWRRVALFGLPVFLAAAIASHLYAVLVVVPLGLAELARTIERRRVDWLVWMGLVAVGLLLLPANPVIFHIFHLPELAKKTWGHRVIVSELIALWPQFLSTSATYLGLLAIVSLCRDRVSGADDPPSLITREVQTPAADWVLVIGFCRLGVRRRPEIAVLLAAWVVVAATGSIVTSRYALRTTTITTAHIAAGGGCFRLFNVWGKLPSDDLPIVVSDFYVFHQLHHYAPEPLKPRLVFLVDREFGGLIAPMVPFYAKVFAAHMEGFDQFVRSHRSFYLYDCGSIGKLPLLDWLLEAGATVHDSGLVDTPDIQLRRELYRVTLEGAASSAPAGWGEGETAPPNRPGADEAAPSS